MPDIAQSVVIDHVNGKFLVDGREFPWHINEDGPIPHAVPGETLRTVTVTLIVDKVEVITSPTGITAGRDDRGDIRTRNGDGVLIAHAGDTRADVQGWRDIAIMPRYIAMYDAALALFDTEAAANV